MAAGQCFGEATPKPEKEPQLRKEVFFIRILIGILVLFLLVLLVKYIRLKKQIRYLTGQTEALAAGRTEKMLDMSLVDRDLEKLAGSLNAHYAGQRYAVACAMQHEEHLKESISNISHDLRTPLTVLTGHLQLVLKTELAEEQKRRVETALHKAERMNALIGSFYELSLLDTDQAAPEKERINFSNMLQDFLTENAPLLESRGILPEIRLPSVSVFLETDRGMMERILQNLLSNAVRYCDGIVKISLAEWENGRAVLCVENNLPAGIIIDTERMFERFYTGDPSRHGEGTGLGLAVVRGLAEKLGGGVEAGREGEMLWVRVVV